MNQTADIVIAGAGVIGLCTAMQLARRSKLRIVVLDRAKSPGEGSTGASSAICRHKYSRRETVLLARDGVHAYHRWPDFVQLPDPLAHFQHVGMVWLGDGRQDWPAWEAQRLGELGVRVQVLDDAELQAKFPAINPCIDAPEGDAETEHVCRGGGPHLFELEAGFMDPVDVLHDLIRGVRAKGVEVRFGTEVVGLDTSGGRLSGVRLADGSVVSCSHVVSASGPWCEKLFQEVGLACSWKLDPTRIQMVHLDRPASVQGDLPIVCDQAGGIYFRPQNRGQQIIVGSVVEADELESVQNPDDFATYADDDYVRIKLFYLEHRLRGLGDIRRPRGYSGLYTINRADYHPIVGPTPIDGFYVANGCSGHSFKLAPALGSLIAQMLAGKADQFDTDVDPGYLAFDRAPIKLESHNVLA
jgi:glycine/D-amino acid oxidase-like deaminating enzyme